MRNLKILILAFGALGVISLLMDMDLLKAGLKEDTVNYALVLAGFVLPAIMGLMAIAKPPMVAWQAAVALAGFALVGVKFRIWETLPKIADAGTAQKLGMIAVVGGVVVSLLATLKPENRA